MKRFFANPGLLVFIGLALLIALANREFFFVTAWHENGDFAVNALQIERAKHLDELYGNYSRFHFNHPGPAFFYVYAVGEIVFHDWLHLVPSPHGGHALAGMLLQVFFFTAALSVAAGWIRRPLFLPLALLAAAIHFGLAENTFTSIWPPHVLLMPFLCFLVACASLAAGRIRHLPLAALAGCFLVHGYVAQPLFVLTLFPLACWLGWRRTRLPQETLRAFLSRHRAWLLPAAACIALFVLPLLIDLTYGGDSNFSRILDFLRGHRHEHQSLWRSVVYLLAFFCYLHTQDVALPEFGPTDTSFLGQNLPWFLVWAGLAGIVGFHLVRLWRAKDQPERPFVFGLVLLLAVTLGLSLVWGVMQVGPMFEFNGHFYYATLYALLLLLAAALSRWLPTRGTIVVGALCCLGAATIVWRLTRPPLSTDVQARPILADTAKALKADPMPQAPKLLVFAHDDWGKVASIALALKRSGHSYRVDGNWSFMFGQYRTFRPSPPDFDLKGMSVWRFVHEGTQRHLFPFFGDLGVQFEPYALDPTKADIDCTKGGDLPRFALFGLTTPDGDAAWTNMPDAGLRFRSPPVTHDVVFTIVATPFAPRHRGIASQPMDLYVNGHLIASYNISAKATVTARIPASIWNLRRVITIVFHLPDAVSPAKLRMSADPRILGWAIESLSFRSAP